MISTYMFVYVLNVRLQLKCFTYNYGYYQILPISQMNGNSCVNTLHFMTNKNEHNVNEKKKSNVEYLKRAN